MLSQMLRSARNNISFISSTAIQNAAITVPTEQLAGDLLVLFDRSTGASAPALVTPAGFTNVTNVASSLVRSAYSYFVTTSNIAGNTLTAMSTTNSGKILMLFRTKNGINQINALSVSQQSTDSTPTDQVVSCGSSPLPLIVFAGYRQDNAGTPSRTMTPTEDATINIGATTTAKYKIYNINPLETTNTLNDVGNGNQLHSFYLEIL